MSWRFPRRCLSALGRRRLPQLFNALSLSAHFRKRDSGGWAPQSCEDGKPRHSVHVAMGAARKPAPLQYGRDDPFIRAR